MTLVIREINDSIILRRSDVTNGQFGKHDSIEHGGGCALVGKHAVASAIKNQRYVILTENKCQKLIQHRA